MNRAANQNFFSVLAVSLAIFLLAALCFSGAAQAEKLTDGAQASIDALYEENPDGFGDVEGWALIAQGFGYAFLLFSWVAIRLAAWFLAFLGGALALLSLAARLIYRGRGGRLLCYRIIMGFVYGLLGLALWLLLAMGFWGTPLLLLIILITAVLIWGLVNTYGSRVRWEEPEE